MTITVDANDYYIVWSINQSVSINFYRAMHFSAKRGIASDRMSSVRLSVRLSVRPSVRDVGGLDLDHIGWKSWKLTARTNSPTPSLFGAQTPSTYSQGNMGKCWAD